MKLYDIDEKMMIKYKSIPIISALFQCHYSPWEFHNRTSLIPRNVTNHILVFPIWDIRMNLQPSRRRNPINQTSDDDQVSIGHVDLHVAVRRGDLSGVRQMVARDIDVVSRKDSQGNLPLHLAVVNGNKEIFEFLVEKYPKGSYVLNQEKKCPIYLAVENDCVEFVTCMLGACVNDANCVEVLSKVQPIVHLAITRQNLEMVKTILERRHELIKSKDDQGWTPLSYAAFKGHLNIVQHLQKTFPNSISYRNSDQDGSLPVHKACLGDKVEVLKLFHLKSLFGEDNNGRNILHIAAKERDNRLKDVVSYLVNLAIKSNTSKKLLNKQDGCGYKPFELAQRTNNDEIAKLLSDAGMY